MGAYQRLHEAEQGALWRSSEIVSIRHEDLIWAIETIDDADSVRRDFDRLDDIESDLMELLKEMDRAPVFNLTPHARVLINGLRERLGVV